MMAATELTLVHMLRDATLAILDQTRPAFSVRSEVLHLKSVFETAAGTGLEAVDDIATGETITTEGVAISPTMAAMCVDDFARTVQFIRGAHAAIHDLRRAITDRPARVLYAGCGPWAALAVPLMTVLPADQVDFTLLDIHRESIESVTGILDSLELRDHVSGLIVADATTYRLDPNALPDMIMIEMMRAGLEAEPQVGVSMHLLRQAPHAVLIPAEIVLDLILIDPRREFDLESEAGESVQRDRIHVGRVLMADRTTLLEAELLTSVVEIPAHDDARYRPMISTEIRVYADHVLKDYDSGITCPRKLMLDGELAAGDLIRFSYELGEQPRLRAERLVNTIRPAS